MLGRNGRDNGRTRETSGSRNGRARGCYKIKSVYPGIHSTAIRRFENSLWLGRVSLDDRRKRKIPVTFLVVHDNNHPVQRVVYDIENVST